MPIYRCFVIDKESHISERLSIESDSDDFAIVQAGAVLELPPDMTAIEVWDEARLVQKLRQTGTPRSPDGSIGERLRSRP